MRFIKPLDEERLHEIARRFTRVLTVEENVVTGGFGSGVLEAFARLGGTLPSVRIHGIPDGYVEHGTPAELYRLQQLDSAGIADVVRELLHGGTTR